MTLDAGHAAEGRMDIDLNDIEVADPAVAAQRPSGDPTVRRAAVVRRLLAMQLSVGTLLALLPEWAPLIHGVAADDTECA